MSEIRRDPVFSGAGESSEQIQGHPTQSETQIERLQDQLADLLYPSDGGEIDVEVLDTLLEQMEAVCPLLTRRRAWSGSTGGTPLSSKRRAPRPRRKLLRFPKSGIRSNHLPGRCPSPPRSSCCLAL